MGLILSEPINKMVEIPKILMKISVKDANNQPKCKQSGFFLVFFIHAQYRGSR
jgi:hypothetical protein